MAEGVFGEMTENPNPLVQKLATTLDYFVPYNRDQKFDYEESYHLQSIDPDGRVRNLLEEREISLSGCNEIVTYLAGKSPGKIFDFGCGPGWILSTLDRSQWEPHGLEISKFAAQHASQFGSIFCGDYLNYQERNFDYVVMNHVIEHLTNPLEAIDKVKDILKPGGIFILGTPDFDSAAARRFGSRFRMLHDKTHISLFSSDSMFRLLRDKGFQILEIQYPYFETKWFTKENLLKIIDQREVSPPFYGSFMTFFAQKVE
jgi:2-polyprenyl-3-methyl-5-hydroxy-6-metoxy-1,4-benzoquinol methylase